MSFILKAEVSGDLQVNAWNWRPTLELLHQFNIIDDSSYDSLGCNGCGASADETTAIRIADFLDAKLKSMRPGERIRADLTATAEPKQATVFTPTTKAEDIDAVNLYSASYEWLVTFAEFARRSGGFTVL